MLDSVLAAFLDALDEREFDAPFMALLRARGFFDIHRLHGSTEFGKDFIAKKEEGGETWQFVFQSKAGKITLGIWNGLRGQIDLLRRSRLGHPNFDTAASRRAVLLTTGRLVGGAALDCQDYCAQLRENGEVGLDIWDRETLIEMMRDEIGVGLAERSEGPLFSIVASADARNITEKQLERFARRWFTDSPSPWASALEAAVVAKRLASGKRFDLACWAGLCFVRAAQAQAHAAPTSEWAGAAESGRKIFAVYALLIWNRFDESLTSSQLIHGHRETSALITYAVRSVRTLEIFSLLGLLPPSSDIPAASRIAVRVRDLIARHLGTSYLISDRWAVAAIPSVLLLAREGHREAAAGYLFSIVTWVARRYGHGSGLAGPSSTPLEEVTAVLGGSVPATRIARRPESLIVPTVLDLAAFLKLPGTYRHAKREALLAGALPSVVTTHDTAGQYTLDGAGVSHEVNVAYANELPDDWREAAPHLRAAAAPRRLQSLGASWDHLAASAVLRDRYFICAWQDILEARWANE